MRDKSCSDPEGARRQNAVWHETRLINDDMAAHSDATKKPGDNRFTIYVVIAIILFKPVADYCIELYSYVAGQYQDLLLFFGL